MKKLPPGEMRKSSSLVTVSVSKSITAKRRGGTFWPGCSLSRYFSTIKRQSSVMHFITK